MGRTPFHGILLRSMVILSLFAFKAIGDELRVGTITKNVDGDTVWLESEDTRLKVRFHNIDAPETHLAAPGGVVGQGEWGKSASKHLEDLIPVGTQVEVRDEGQDKYKRTLGHVLLKGVDTGLEMVRAGWAIPYVICSGATCNEDHLQKERISDYVAFCRAARTSGRGIFDPESPLTEMPFEFRLRVQKRRPDKFVGDYERGIYFSPADYDKVDVCQRIFFAKETDAGRLGYQPAENNSFGDVFNFPRSSDFILPRRWAIEE